MRFSGLLAREFSRVDLLFSDVVMPGNTSGYALAQQAVELQPELKVLMTLGLVVSGLL